MPGNWEDAALKIDDGIHLNWPKIFSRGKWWLGEDPGFTPNKKYQEQLDRLYNYFTEAKANTTSSTSEQHLAYAAMKAYLMALKGFLFMLLQPKRC